MRALMVGLVVGCLLWTTIAARAQLLVFDEQNFVPNLGTLAQTVLLAIDSAANMVALGASALDDINDIMDEVNGLISETNALMWDIQVIESQSRALFGLESAPASTSELQARLQLIRAYHADVLLAARRIQTIMRAAQDAIQRIINITAKIGSLAGNKAAQANMQEQLSLLVKASQEHGVATAAYQQAMLAQAQEKPLIEESLMLINRDIMSDWPRP